MSVARVVEISAESTKSFEDAIQQGVTRAGETLHNLRAAWIKKQEVVLKEGKITGYRVIVKVTFVLD